jgi:hypothetical protein
MEFEIQSIKFKIVYKVFFFIFNIFYEFICSWLSKLPSDLLPFIYLFFTLFVIHLSEIPNGNRNFHR